MPLASQANAGGRSLAQNTARVRMFFMGVPALALTVTLSKNGGGFAAAAGMVRA